MRAGQQRRKENSNEEKRKRVMEGTARGGENLHANKILRVFGKDESRCSIKGALPGRWYSMDWWECWDWVFHRLSRLV